MYKYIVHASREFMENSGNEKKDLRKSVVL